MTEQLMMYDLPVFWFNFTSSAILCLRGKVLNHCGARLFIMYLLSLWLINIIVVLVECIYLTIFITLHNEILGRNHDCLIGLFWSYQLIHIRLPFISFSSFYVTGIHVRRYDFQRLWLFWELCPSYHYIVLAITGISSNTLLQSLSVDGILSISLPQLNTM